MQKYRSTVTLTSADCDDTGLVDASCYPALVNRAVEDWFDEVLAFPFSELHVQKGIGIPTVDIDLRIHRPGLLGETLATALSITRVGERSLKLNFGAPPCMDADIVLVWVKNENGRLRSAAIPDSLRQRMQHHDLNDHPQAATGESTDG